LLISRKSSSVYPSHVVQTRLVSYPLILHLELQTLRAHK
jgi:hypothetical protein